MKTIREMMDIVEAAQTDKYAELKQKIRDLSQSGNEREAHKQRYELNRLMMLDRDREARGVAEGSKLATNRPESQFSREIVKAYPDGGVELKCGHKTSAKLPKNPIGKKIFCGRCYELRNKEQEVDEDQATARMGLMSAVGSDPGAPDRQRMAQQAVERLASEK